GDVQIVNTGSLTVASLGSATTSNNLASGGGVSLQATGAITVNAKITVSGAAFLDANGGNLTINSAVDPTTVQLDSDADVLMNGAVTVTAGGAMTVTSVSTNGGSDVTLTTSSGDIAVSSISANGHQVVVNAAGAITDGNGGLTNISASSLGLTAGTGIGAGDV